MLKNEKGITMLALVITVILVCLLAAVTISFSLGEDGVFSKSRRINFLEDISELQKELSEQEVLARANGKSNDIIKADLERSLNKWLESHQSYKDFTFELRLNDEEDTFILTYKSGGTEEEENWLNTVNFPRE